MLGLPKSTELHRQLPKKTLYAKFQMKTAAREKIDEDISRIIIVNEVSPEKVYIDAGDCVKAFFVMLVILKRKAFQEKTISTIAKMIPQNMLLILQYGEDAKLAVYHTKLIQTYWQPIDSFSIELKGLNLDTVWENIIVQIGGIKIEQDNTLDEQILIDDTRQKLLNDIIRLEKQARREVQPRKKFEIVEQINKLKRKLEELHNG